MSRNAFVDPDRRLIVFWSPKCGCTTVARWFLHSVLQRTDDLRHSGMHVGAWLDAHGYHVRYRDAYAMAAGGHYRTVLFTRNPHNRLASAFVNKFYVYRRSPLDSLESLEPFARDLLSSGEPPYGREAGRYVGISFREFVAMLVDAKRRGLPVDHHWDTQFPTDVDSTLSYPRIDHVVRLEAFATDFTAVQTSLGLDGPPTGALNRTRFPEGFTERAGGLGDRRTVEMLAERIAIRAENLYDAQSTAAVKNLYAVDYARLPYEPPS